MLIFQIFCQATIQRKKCCRSKYFDLVETMLFYRSHVMIIGIKKMSVYHSLDFVALWKLVTIFWSPATGVGDLWFRFRPSVCPSVRSSVRSRSQNPFIGFFWFFAQSCGLWMQRKWHFRILAKKSRFCRFGPKMVKNWPFWPKNGHFDLFFQIRS